ncbi:MAG TPA: ATP-binding cassette domain-containing protein [Candidatus Binatia bacterium]|nr:ATP-binding cassette domain-containing protein [Candidatus Binatia bacterium]
MISFQHVDYSIDGRPILRDITFDVPQGATTVILGPSGSGKSTTLRLLLGLARPDAGEIRIDNEDITRMSEKRLRQVRQRVGMVFQQGALFDSMTVGENVAFSLIEHDKVPDEELEGTVRSHLQLVGLDPDLIDRMPDQLSGGMQRRVAIARALAARDPNILLYDEPTTGLDPQSAERITDLIVELRDRMKKTSIMVTHDIADAFKVANTMAVLNEGRLVFEGTPSDLAHTNEPFINEFLAPFRKAVLAATQRVVAVPGTPRPTALQ